MKFEHVFSRADDEILQHLIGRQALKLIYLLDGKVTPPQLSSIILGIFSPAGILLTKLQRDFIIDLLRKDEAEELSQILLGRKSENPYSDLKTVRFARGSNAESKLLSFFEIESKEDTELVKVGTEESCTPVYPLFAHQITALAAVTQHLANAPHKVLLHMPTGSGKTRTAMNYISDHLRCNPTSAVVWLASTEELCAQAMEEFQKSWKHLGNRNLPTYRFWGKYDAPLEKVASGIVVAGMSKIYNLAKRDSSTLFKLAANTSLVVMDEAHQSVADTYKIVIDTLLAIRPDVALLGLTATPGRTYNDVTQDEVLSKYYAKRKVKLTVDGYDNPVEYLIDQEYLARPKFEKLFYKSGLTLSQEEIAKMALDFDFSPAVLGRLAEDDARNLAIVKRIELLAKSHSRIIVFALTVEHSNLLACVLRSRGILADSITGASEKTLRENVIKTFKTPSNDVRVICNYGVLTTGFDAPNTSCAVIARPTKSLVLYSQMVGRAIRGKKAGGNLEAEIITVIDEELPGFNSVSAAFENWEDVWRIET